MLLLLKWSPVLGHQLDLIVVGILDQVACVMTMRNANGKVNTVHLKEGGRRPLNVMNVMKMSVRRVTVFGQPSLGLDCNEYGGVHKESK